MLAIGFCNISTSVNVSRVFKPHSVYKEMHPSVVRPNRQTTVGRFLPDSVVVILRQTLVYVHFVYIILTRTLALQLLG